MSSPAVVAAVPLVAGVFAGALGRLPLAFLLVLIALSWCVTAIGLARRWDAPFLIACLSGYFAIGGALGAAAAHAVSHAPLVDAFLASGSPAAPARLTGVLREDAAVTAAGVTMSVDVTAIDGDGGRRTTRGGVRASVAGSLARPIARSWRQGRTIVFDASLREPSAYCDLGVADDRERLARQGIVLFASVKSGALVSVVSRASPIAEAAAALRAYVRRSIQDAVGRWSERSGGIVTAILIGDRSALDPDDERRLQEAGTYHVIAISGGNIALLTALLVTAGRACRLSPRQAAACSIGLLGFYGYAAGLAPSVMRATLAGLVYLAARVIDHRGPPMNALGIAAIVAAAVFPLSVFDPGFILSFGATTAIVVAASRLVTIPPRDPDPGRFYAVRRSVWIAIRLLGAATLCAEIALAPIGARLFGRVSLAGLVLNFAAIPLMSIIQIAGLSALIAYPLSENLAAACGWVANVGTAALLRSAAFVDVAPWLVLDVPAPPIWMIAIWYLAWATLFFGWGRRRIRIAASACAAAIAAAIVWSPPALRAYRAALPPAGWMRVAFLDVGQGDATLVASPGAPPLLVDAGGVPGSSFDLGRRVTVPALWALGVTTLGALVVTHGDPDHIGGAPAVLRAFAPREVWEGISVPTHIPLQQLRDAAARTHSEWRTVRRGETRQWGAAQIRVLNPPDPEWERPKVRNDDSVVLDIRFGSVAIVLPGDVGQAVDATLATHGEIAGRRMTIVKAPHHGSAGSSSAAFIASTKPAAVIFSAGRRNPFGHPAPAALERYRAAGARIFRTDLDGEVVVDTDGENVVIWTWAGKSDVLIAK